jgi:hypothetical protein
VRHLYLPYAIGRADEISVGAVGLTAVLPESNQVSLISGLRTDILRGNGGDGILIGCTTDFDNSLAGLTAVMKEWAAPMPTTVLPQLNLEEATVL